MRISNRDAGSAQAVRQQGARDFSSAAQHARRQSRQSNGSGSSGHGSRAGQPPNAQVNGNARSDVSNDATPSAPETNTSRSYNDTLDSLAQTWAQGVDIDARTVTRLTGGAGKQFGRLVQYQLQQQVANGKRMNLPKALGDAKKALLDRTDAKLAEIGKDPGDGIDVIRGYFKPGNKGGQDTYDAGLLAYNQEFDGKSDSYDPAGHSYNANVGLLADFYAGSADVVGRNINHLTNTQFSRTLYQALVQSRMEGGQSRDAARKAVNHDLQQGIYNRGNDIGNVYDGYMSHNGGEKDTEKVAAKVTISDSAVWNNAAYGKMLDTLGGNIADGVKYHQRRLPGLNNDNADLFGKLVSIRLRQQIDKGEKPDIAKAINGAKNDLRASIGQHAGNQRADGAINIFDGYWNRNGGAREAALASYPGYAKLVGGDTPKSFETYDKNVSALADLLAGRVFEDGDSNTRTLLYLDGSPETRARYKQLIQSQRAQGKSESEAVKTVNKDLDTAMLSDHTGSAYSVYRGYMERHDGDKDARRLAGAVYDANSGGAKQNRAVNTLGRRFASAINPGQGTIGVALSGASSLDIKFEGLITKELERQKADGGPIDLDGAYTRAKRELFHSTRASLRNQGKDVEAGMDVLKDYWAKDDGGAKYATEDAYSAYRSVVDTKDYAPTCNYKQDKQTLSGLIGGSVITETRSIEHLTNTRTYQNLYASMVQSLVKTGSYSPREATEKVNTDLRQGIQSYLNSSAASDTVAAEKLDIFDGYWSRHGGPTDAGRLATAAYGDQIGASVDPDSKWGAIDTSQYQSLDAMKPWESLTDGMSGQEQLTTERNLNRPLAAARLLSDNWDAWGMHDGRKFSDTSGLPPEGKQTLKFIRQNPALLKALDVAGADGHKPDGIIEQRDVDAFIENTENNIQSGADTFAEFKKNNRTGYAEGMPREVARSGALLMANQQLADVGAKPNLKNGLTNRKNLLALASDNPGLAPSLTGTANLWSSPGMLKLLDRAGDSIATTSEDGLYGWDNLSAWVSESAPGDTSEAVSLLSGASYSSLTADVDLDKLDADVFKHPGRYTGKQKAAVLQDLIDLKAKSAAANEAGIFDGSELQERGVDMTSGFTGESTQMLLEPIQKRIDTLTGDKDVQNFYSKNGAGALQDIVNSSPALKASAQDYYDNQIKTGKALSADLRAKGPDGKPVTPARGLSTFIGNADRYQQMLGKKGKPRDDFDLREAVANSGETKTLENYYENNLVSGKLLSNALDEYDPSAPNLAEGKDKGIANRALAAYQDESSVFMAALPAKYVNKLIPQQNQNFGKALQDFLLDNVPREGIVKFLGDGHGNLDTKNLRKTIDMIEQNDPDAFVDPTTGEQYDPKVLIKLFSNVWSALTGGTGARAALKDLNKTLNNDTFWSRMGGYTPGESRVATGRRRAQKGAVEAYRSGALQAVGGLLIGGLGAVYGTNQDNSDPLNQWTTAGIVSLGFSGLLHGASKGITTGSRIYQRGQDNRPAERGGGRAVAEADSNRGSSRYSTASSRTAGSSSGSSGYVTAEEGGAARAGNEADGPTRRHIYVHRGGSAGAVGTGEIQPASPRGDSAPASPGVRSNRGPSPPGGGTAVVPDPRPGGAGEAGAPGAGRTAGVGAPGTAPGNIAGADDEHKDPRRTRSIAAPQRNAAAGPRESNVPPRRAGSTGIARAGDVIDRIDAREPGLPFGGGQGGGVAVPAEGHDATPAQTRSNRASAARGKWTNRGLSGLRTGSDVLSGFGGGVFAVTSLLAGAQSVEDGDAVGAAFNITSGVSFGAGFITEAAESGVRLASYAPRTFWRGAASRGASAAAASGGDAAAGASRAAARASSATLSRVAGVAGTVGSIAGVVVAGASAAYLIYEAIEQTKEEEDAKDAFADQAAPRYKQWDIHNFDREI